MSKIRGQPWDVVSIVAHKRKNAEAYIHIFKFVEVKMECTFSSLGPLLERSGGEGIRQKCLIVMDLDHAEHNAAHAVGLAEADCTFHITKNLSGEKHLYFLYSSRSFYAVSSSLLF